MTGLILSVRSEVDFDAQGGRWGCAAFMRAADRGPCRADELLLARRLGDALRIAQPPWAGGQGASAQAAGSIPPPQVGPAGAGCSARRTSRRRRTRPRAS